MGSRQDAIPWNFSGYHVSGVCVGFAGVIDEVTNHCNLHATWVVFLGPEVGDNASAMTMQSGRICLISLTLRNWMVFVPVVA